MLQVLRPTSWRCKIQENPQDPGRGHQVRHGDNLMALITYLDGLNMKGDISGLKSLLFDKSILVISWLLP